MLKKEARRGDIIVAHGFIKDTPFLRGEANVCPVIHQELRNREYAINRSLAFPRCLHRLHEAMSQPIRAGRCEFKEIL